MPPLDPDTEAMITAPAATVAGSANLLDAVNARLVEAGFKPTCDEAGNWHYVPAASIDGPRARRATVSDEAARIAVEAA